MTRRKDKDENEKEGGGIGRKENKPEDDYTAYEKEEGREG